MGTLWRQKGKGKTSNWMMRFYQDGEEVNESSGTKDWHDAKRILAQREGRIADGEPVAELGVGRNAYTFDEGATAIENDYIANGRKSLRAVRRRVQKHLKPVFGGRRLSTITTDQIRAYTADRRKAGAKPTTINRELAALKRIFRLAMQARRIIVMPHIEMLDEQKSVRTGFFEAEQFRAVRGNLPVYLREPVTFAFITGWRFVSEVLTLEWHNIEREAGNVRLYTSKNGEGRTFPYAEHPELRTVIEQQDRERKRLAQKGRICPLVFHRDGEPLFYVGKADPATGEQPEMQMATWARKAWTDACKLAGVPARIPHDFRRTAVRELVRSRVPERTAMLLTGHKTRAVFDRYNIVDEADLRSGVRMLAEGSGARTLKKPQRR
jgi:integrase